MMVHGSLWCHAPSLHCPLRGRPDNWTKEPLRHPLIEITVRRKLVSFENKYLGLHTKFLLVSTATRKKRAQISPSATTTGFSSSKQSWVTEGNNLTINRPPRQQPQVGLDTTISLDAHWKWWPKNFDDKRHNTLASANTATRQSAKTYHVEDFKWNTRQTRWHNNQPVTHRLMNNRR